MRKLLVISSALIFLPSLALAFNIGDSQIFNIEPTYDAAGREQTTALLKKISAGVYFYVDNTWWSSLSTEEQTQAINSLNNLGEEFDNKISPALIQNFGDIWSPGIDKDTRITILFHPMRETSGGYFNSADEYSKTQIPKSNEREMLYLNSVHILNPLLKSFLAHEFQHLISFNQKTRLRGVAEDTWLNEARSEYALTILGYDSVFTGSNLEKRVKNFLDKPYDSLVEWKNQPADYGIVNLFTQYLADHYGAAVLKESLLSSKIGIESINEALKKLGFADNFSQIFIDWTVAVFLNNCSLESRYCYFNQGLQNFRVVPLANFLPPVPQTSLSVVNTAKAWAASWYKFFGAKGNLTLEFVGSPGANFEIPYLLEDKQGKYAVNFLVLDKLYRGKITVKNFDQQFLSLTIIPSLSGKLTGFSESEPGVQFSWTVSVNQNSDSEENQAEIQKLLEQISRLKTQILALQQRLLDLQNPASLSCRSFSKNLYYGLTGSDEVRCLQQFLKARGQSIYPEGLVTGNYYSATALAVKKYQASKGIIQTGYFGPLTRGMVNSEIGL